MELPAIKCGTCSSVGIYTGLCLVTMEVHVCAVHEELSHTLGHVRQESVLDTTRAS